MNFIIIGGLIVLGLVIFQSLWYAKRKSELEEKIVILENDNVAVSGRLNSEVAKRIANKDGRNPIDLLTKY